MVPSLSLYFIWKTDGNRNQHKWLGHKTYMYFYWWVFLGHSHEENGSASKSYSKNVFWPLLLGIGQSLLLVLIYLFHSWVIFFYITFIFLVHNVVPFMCIREAPDSFIYIRDSSLKKMIYYNGFYVVRARIETMHLIYSVPPSCEENSFFKCQKIFSVSRTCPSPDLFFASVYSMGKREKTHF